MCHACLRHQPVFYGSPQEARPCIHPRHSRISCPECDRCRQDATEISCNNNDLSRAEEIVAIRVQTPTRVCARPGRQVGSDHGFAGSGGGGRATGRWDVGLIKLDTDLLHAGMTAHCGTLLDKHRHRYQMFHICHLLPMVINDEVTASSSSGRAGSRHSYHR